MRKLFIIPARGGSKGLPRKNILPLNGKPLIHYTIEAALKARRKLDVVCLSTDDREIVNVAQHYPIDIPFLRPPELASDTATSNDVVRHALAFYQNQGTTFDIVVLLQPTSPLRKGHHIREAVAAWNNSYDKLVSVRVTDSNPYFNLLEEQGGMLIKSKEGAYSRRQDAPTIYEINGAIYIYRVEHNLNNVPPQRMGKYVMSNQASIDIDTKFDLLVAESIIKMGEESNNS
jgi:N-acylneuraminate cytidylyltransferase